VPDAKNDQQQQIPGAPPAPDTEEIVIIDEDLGEILTSAEGEPSAESAEPADEPAASKEPKPASKKKPEEPEPEPEPKEPGNLSKGVEKLSQRMTTFESKLGRIDEIAASLDTLAKAIGRQGGEPTPAQETKAVKLRNELASLEITEADAETGVSVADLKGLVSNLRKEIKEEFRQELVQESQRRSQLDAGRQEWVGQFEAAMPDDLKGIGPRVLQAYDRRMSRINLNGLPDSEQKNVIREVYNDAFREVAATVKRPNGKAAAPAPPPVAQRVSTASPRPATGTRVVSPGARPGAAPPEEKTDEQWLDEIAKDFSQS